MCDSLLATPGTTLRNVMLFAKNSDRQPNEAQVVEIHPAAEYPPGAQLRCTYILIPQVRRTNAVLLCRPFWMWGAEMGANEHGVAIGNEGLHARIAAPEAEALTGMDLVRLVLERAVTARDAVGILIQLLENYGQGGNCGHREPSYYNNGFMVADPREGFVIETIGREWLIEPIATTRSLSNIYSSGRNGVSVSAGLRPLLLAAGTADDGVQDYGSLITNPHREHIGQACARRERSSSLLAASAPNIDTATMIAILRDHGMDPPMPEAWHPENATKISICMHAGPDDRQGQTTGSMISELHSEGSVHWVTATGSPCVSIFKPVLMDVPLSLDGPNPNDSFDPRSYWWRHEYMVRVALSDRFGAFLRDIADERDELEADFRKRVASVVNGGSAFERAQVVAECWRTAAAAEERWHGRVRWSARLPETPFRESWDKLNGVAGLDLGSALAPAYDRG